MNRYLFLFLFLLFYKVSFSQIGYLGGYITLGSSYQLSDQRSNTSFGIGVDYEVLFPTPSKLGKSSISIISTYDNILKRAYIDNYNIVNIRFHQIGLGLGSDYLNYLDNNAPDVGFVTNTILKYQFVDLQSSHVLTFCNMVGFSFKMNELYKGKLLFHSELDLQKTLINNREYQFVYLGVSIAIHKKLHQKSKVFFESWKVLGN